MGHSGHCKSNKLELQIIITVNAIQSESRWKAKESQFIDLPTFNALLFQVTELPRRYFPKHAFLQTSGGIDCLSTLLAALVIRMHFSTIKAIWDLGTRLLRIVNMDRRRKRYLLEPGVPIP